MCGIEGQVRMDGQQAAKAAAIGYATIDKGSPGHPAKVGKQPIFSP